MRRALVLLVSAFSLTACLVHPLSDEAKPKGLIGPVVSPNGEPLSGGALGRPDCDDAMDKWFDRVDANHDGVIDHAEFLADARAQFMRMDLDHDGFITTDELTTFRMPYLGGGEAKPGAPPHHQRQDSSSLTVAAGLEDPVMAADSNLDFQVSLDEFIALADSKFAKLAKDGRMTRQSLDAICWPDEPKE